MRHPFLLTCFIGFSFYLLDTADADFVVFDNIDGATVSSALVSDFSVVGPPPFTVETADDAMLSSTTVINGIEWTGIYRTDQTVAPNGPDNFLINIFSDVNSAPGAVLASFNVGDAANRTDSGSFVAGEILYDFSADISFTLDAGVNYWFSIVNDSTAISNTSRYFWTGVDSGNGQVRLGDDPWNDRIPQGLDFRLRTEQVPEPGSCAVLGFLAMAGLSRRKRK